MSDYNEQLRDEWLLLRIQEGSREAFEALVKRWQERLWRHAFQLTGRDDASWDVVQETWMAATKGLPRLRDPAALRRWLFKTATFCAATWWRRCRRQESAPELLNEAAGSIDEPSRTESAEDVREALARLPAETGTILSLHYVEGFPLWQVAEILGIPEGTVKSRLYHARGRLRAILERTKP